VRLLRPASCNCHPGGIAGLLNNVPEFTLPELPEGMRPSSGMRSATFDVLFLDEVRGHATVMCCAWASARQAVKFAAKLWCARSRWLACDC
jgi:hypothetical protein